MLEKNGAPSKLVEQNPWMVDGQLSREKIRSYIEAEEADLLNRIMAGADAQKERDAQKVKFDRYLSAWTDEEKESFLIIYFEEQSSVSYKAIADMKADTARIEANTESILAQQKAAEMSGYFTVIVIIIVAAGIFMATR